MTDVSPAYTDAKRGFLFWRDCGLMEDNAAKILQKKKGMARSNTERMGRTHGGLAGQLDVLKKI